MPIPPQILYISPRLRGAMTQRQSDALAVITTVVRADEMDRYRMARAASVSTRGPIIVDARILAYQAPVSPCDDDGGFPPPAAPALPMPTAEAA